VSRVVVDASVVVKWFRTEREPHVVEARALFDAIMTRRMVAVAPTLLFTELLNVAARRWRWERTKLLDLVADLDKLEIAVREPKIADVAEWTARGLSAYDASYVALARAESSNVVTDDTLILKLAPHDAISLEMWALGDSA